MKKTILTLILALSLQGLAAASAADNDYIMCPGDRKNSNRIYAATGS